MYEVEDVRLVCVMGQIKEEEKERERETKTNQTIIKSGESTLVRWKIAKIRCQNPRIKIQFGLKTFSIRRPH